MTARQLLPAILLSPTRSPAEALPLARALRRSTGLETHVALNDGGEFELTSSDSSGVLIHHLRTPHSPLRRYRLVERMLELRYLWGRQLCWGAESSRAKQ